MRHLFPGSCHVSGLFRSHTFRWIHTQANNQRLSRLEFWIFNFHGCHAWLVLFVSVGSVRLHKFCHRALLLEITVPYSGGALTKHDAHARRESGLEDWMQLLCLFSPKSDSFIGSRSFRLFQSCVCVDTVCQPTVKF